MRTMAEIFGAPVYAKPRRLRQTLAQGCRLDAAPRYIERLGIPELADFLEAAGERLDYVKIVTTQVIYSRPDWLRRKVATYQAHEVQPYLDHGFFMLAYRQGAVEAAMAAAADLGFRVIEFMNTADDISPQQWREWRKLARELGMAVIFEHHPLYHWDRSYAPAAATAEAILAEAAPFLDDGAFTVMIDHEEFDLQGERAADEIGKVVEALGLENLVFEATSPKEGPMLWRDNLRSYFRMFGADSNVSNVMPSQALYVESMRRGGDMIGY